MSKEMKMTSKYNVTPESRLYMYVTIRSYMFVHAWWNSFFGEEAPDSLVCEYHLNFDAGGRTYSKNQIQIGGDRIVQTTSSTSRDLVIQVEGPGFFYTFLPTIPGLGGDGPSVVNTMRSGPNNMHMGPKLDEYVSTIKLCWDDDAETYGLSYPKNDKPWLPVKDITDLTANPVAMYTGDWLWNLSAGGGWEVCRLYREYQVVSTWDPVKKEIKKTPTKIREDEVFFYFPERPWGVSASDAAIASQYHWKHADLYPKEP